MQAVHRVKSFELRNMYQNTLNENPTPDQAYTQQDDTIDGEIGCKQM